MFSSTALQWSVLVSRLWMFSCPSECQTLSEPNSMLAEKIQSRIWWTWTKEDLTTFFQNDSPTKILEDLLVYEGIY